MTRVVNWDRWRDGWRQATEAAELRRLGRTIDAKPTVAELNRQAQRAAAKRKAEAAAWIERVKARKGIPVQTGLREGQRIKEDK